MMQFYSNLSPSPFALPMTLEQFQTIPEVPVDFKTDAVFDESIKADIAKTFREFGKLLKEKDQVLHRMKKDLEAFQSSKPPKSLHHRSHLQFKKEQKEFVAQQVEADKGKSMNDLKRKIQASKDWLTKHSQAFTLEGFTSSTLKTIYENLIQRQLRVSSEYLSMLQKHIVNQCRIYHHDLSHKYAKANATAAKKQPKSTWRAHKAIC